MFVLWSEYFVTWYGLVLYKYKYFVMFTLGNCTSGPVSWHLAMLNGANPRTQVNNRPMKYQDKLLRNQKSTSEGYLCTFTDFTSGAFPGIEPWSPVWEAESIPLKDSTNSSITELWDPLKFAIYIILSTYVFEIVESFGDVFILVGSFNHVIRAI